MTRPLEDIVRILRRHEADLRERGVRHAAVFGSTARNAAHTESDVDILIELDPERPLGLFDYARLKSYLGECVGGNADVVNRKTLRPRLRDQILSEAVDAF